MNPFKLAINDTTKFFLPLMFPHSTYDQLLANYFKEAYIGVMDEDAYDDQLTMIFNEEIPIEFEHSHKESFRNDTQCTLQIPGFLSEEYELFLEGSYSKLSDKVKQIILQFWEEDEHSLLYGILYKTEIAKEELAKVVEPQYIDSILRNAKVSDAEFWPPPDILQKELYI